VDLTAEVLRPVVSRRDARLALRRHALHRLRHKIACSLRGFSNALSGWIEVFGNAGSRLFNLASLLIEEPLGLLLCRRTRLPARGRLFALDRGKIAGCLTFAQGNAKWALVHQSRRAGFLADLGDTRQVLWDW
jgi:hypothetical protein